MRRAKVSCSATELGSLLAAIDRDSIGLTLCEIGKGVQLATPQVDGVATMLVLSGTMFLTVGTDPIRLVRSGELVLLPAGVRTELRGEKAEPHKFIDGISCLVRQEGRLVADARVDRECHLVVAAARIAGTSSLKFPELVVIPVTEDPLARQTIALLRSELARPGLGSAALSEALVNACMVMALRMALGNRKAQLTPPSMGARLARALALITARPGDAYNLASLSAAAGMSKATFMRHFTRTTHMTPMAYLQKLRLDEAAATLRSSALSVKTIASNAGFASRSHFSRAFRAHFGAGPTTYRNNLRQMAEPKGVNEEPKILN